MVRVKTNNPIRNEFVYFANKFGSKAELFEEIKKSIDNEEKRKLKKDKKLKKLKDDLNA